MRFAAIAALALCGCQAGRISVVHPYRPGPVLEEAALLARAGFATGNVGFALIDARTGKLVVSSLGAQGFLPGSVSKIATGVAALEVLLPQHRFSTTLECTGTLTGGVLDGDLYLLGGNDPSLGVVQLMELADKLQRAGVRQVRGRFLFDARTYAARIDETQADDASGDPALAPLALEQNKLTVRWRAAGGQGVVAWAQSPLPVEIGVAPQAGPSRFQHTPREGAPETWLLSPDSPTRGEERLPLYAPSADAARVFAQFARGLGVELPDPAPAPLPLPARQPLATAQSATATELLRTTLQTSSNPMAELFLLELARARNGDHGQPASLPEAAALLEAFWRERLPVEVAEGLHLANGSGLSAGTRLSPFQVVAMLRRARDRQGEGPPFFTLLPASGQSGTLRKRLSTPDVALRAWAKTGTMDYGSGLAGHLFAGSGRELIFAAFVNDHDARRARASFPARTPGEAAADEKNASSWTRDAEALLDALVTSWIARY